MSPRRHRRRAKPEWEGREAITVADLPGRGLYVRHLHNPEGVDAVHRPTVATAGLPTRSGHLDEHWLGSTLPEVDVVHVHSLPQRSTPQDVERAITLVREGGRPLVVTAYHLTDPWGVGREHYESRFSPLVRSADAVLTLTPAAAGELRQRYGVESTVLPHPHVVDFVRMRRPKPPRRASFLVGAYLGSLRMPVDPVRFVRALAAAVREVPDARMVVTVHDHLLDRGSVRYAPGVLAAISEAVESAGGVVRAHRPMTDSQLWDHLFGLDAVALPPLRGSHSIWPEACHDLGTTLIIPEGSLAAGQRPCLTYRASDGTIDQAGLTAALLAARDDHTGWRAEPEDRWKERVHVSESLRQLYEQLLPDKARPRVVGTAALA